MLRKKNSEPAQLPEARQELLGFESPAAQPGKKDPKQFLKHNWKKITAVVCVAAVAAAVLLPKTSKKDVQASTQYVEAALERRFRNHFRSQYLYGQVAGEGYRAHRRFRGG